MRSGDGQWFARGHQPGGGAETPRPVCRLGGLLGTQSSMGRKCVALATITRCSNCKTLLPLPVDKRNPLQNSGEIIKGCVILPQGPGHPFPAWRPGWSRILISPAWPDQERPAGVSRDLWGGSGQPQCQVPRAFGSPEWRPHPDSAQPVSGGPLII